jgi:hypothetical protein
MKFTPALLTLCLASLCPPAAADTFFLTDGTQLEGKIIHDDGETYLLEIQVTPTIKDERQVAKSDVERIESEQVDEKAFAKIADLVPTPDLLTEGDYGRRKSAVEAFLKEHPESEFKTQAQEILATLESEAAAVAAGGVKLNQTIIPAEKYQANAFELDSRVWVEKIRAHIGRSEFLAALRLFEDSATEFQSSAAHQEILPLIRQVIDRHEMQVSRLLDEYEARVREQEVGLERMRPEDRTISERALAEEAAAVEARYQEERKTQRRWVIPHPLHRTSLQDSVRQAQQEARRIDNLNQPANAVEGGAAYRNAWNAIHKEDMDPREVSTFMSAARSARLPARYLSVLDEAAKKATAEQAEAKKQAEIAAKKAAEENGAP